jgi:hypothetical protein
VLPLHWWNWPLGTHSDAYAPIDTNPRTIVWTSCGIPRVGCEEERTDQMRRLLEEVQV